MPASFSQHHFYMAYDKDKYITLAIHSYEKASVLKAQLQKAGIEPVIQEINLEQAEVAVGVRVRIRQADLPLALQVVENPESLSYFKKSKRKSDQEILIRVEPNANAINLCRFGIVWAAELHYKVVLMLTYYDDLFETDIRHRDTHNPIEYRRRLERDAKAFIKRLSDRISKMMLKGELPQVEYRTIVAEGVPEDVVIEFGREIKTPLAIMGTRSKDQKEQELIGSVTAEVMDAGSFPVFALPENSELAGLAEVKRVLYFSNMTQQDLLSFDLMARLIGSKRPLGLTLVPTKSVAEAVMKSHLLYFAEHYPAYGVVPHDISDRKFLDNLNTFIKDNAIDLIVIPNKKRSIFSRFFNTSMAHRLLYLSDTPILTTPV